jgi:tRNA (guanine-N7-)-methyltransferase
METPFRTNPIYHVPHLEQNRLPDLIVPQSESCALDLDASFGRSAPLEVDIGSGKGRFVAARAAAFPEHNFIAIERQLRRVRSVQSKVRQHQLSNLRMLRVEASHALAQLIPDDAMHACYVFFPDPWPKRRHASRRLFTETFRTALWKKLQIDGCINFATDHQEYFDFVEAQLLADHRFERTETFVTSPEEQSEFEQLFLEQEKPIGRCSFKKIVAPSA